MSIHAPHPHAVDALVDSMHRYGAALATQPGLVKTGVFKTADGRLVGLAVWESEDAWRAGRSAGGAAVKDDPFDEWESVPTIGLSGPEL
jgi:heme-degrading monooxygenase HmoA